MMQNYIFKSCTDLVRSIWGDHVNQSIVYKLIKSVSDKEWTEVWTGCAPKQAYKIVGA